MKSKYDAYEEVFLRVEKPSRYCGGEYNSFKEFNKGAKFCLLFPDVYEVAISNLGNKIIYNYLNEQENYSCERAYAPWVDMARELKKENLPLFSLDTRTPLNEFDALGISLSYEMSYTNMLLMLDLSQIPLLAKDRDEKYPIVFAGGVCVVNSEPIKEFIDFTVLGEGEVNLTPVLDLIKYYKDNNQSKRELLIEIDKLPFTYVPSLHQEIYENGRFLGYENNKTVTKAIVKDLDKVFFPTKQLVPNIQAVFDRSVLEVFRGCPRGCRFCQAGFCYRPIRGKSVDTLVKNAIDCTRETGFDELSLNSLSTGDFPKIESLIKEVSQNLSPKGVKLSLPSLRLDSFASNKTEGIKKIGSLTFAPEAGSQRLRDVINKAISEEDFENALVEAYKAGYKNVKLYFMIGLPTETDEDILGIFKMCKRAKEIYMREKKRKDVNITASVANFVPKPFTPFQYHKQDSFAEFERKHKLLRDAFYKSGFRLSYHHSYVSKLEGAFSLCGSVMNKVLLSAYNNGAIFDGWTELFNKEAWDKAFSENGLQLDEMSKGYNENDVLPWYNIDVGVDKEFFINEYKKSQREIMTGGCVDKCVGCGSNKLGECKKCW